MKSMVKIGLLSLLLIMNAYATPSKVNTQESDKYDIVTILDKGVKRKVRILKSDSGDTNETGVKISKRTTVSSVDKEGVIVSFIDNEKFSLKAFEKKYTLKLKTKMFIGYYIFYNLSSKSDREIVEEIIANESNVETVKPNWKRKMKTY